jgi:hypothetical protein
MKSIAVGLPCWQSVATPFFQSVMELELPPSVPRKVLEGNLVAEQHERIARWFVEETTAAVLLVLEQDHRFPRNLLARVEQYEDPVVGALYYTRQEPYWPVALVPRPDLTARGDVAPDWDRVWAGDWHDIDLTPLWPSLEDEWRATPGLHSVCAVGMGCMAIQRHVLEDWPKSEPYFQNHYEFGRYWTDDVWFCCRALQFGHGVFVDTGLELPHMGLRDVDHRTHRLHLERRAMELSAPR